MPVYKVTYTRLSKSKSKVASNVYEEGAFREISMVAESEDEAKEIAKKRLAKQFPDKELLGIDENDEEIWAELGQQAQSNYELQGVEVIS